MNKGIIFSLKTLYCNGKKRNLVSLSLIYIYTHTHSFQKSYTLNISFCGKDILVQKNKTENKYTKKYRKMANNEDNFMRNVIDDQQPGTSGNDEQNQSNEASGSDGERLVEFFL